MRSLWVLLAFLSTLLACGERQPAASTPRPALAKSREAQGAFRDILARWLEGSRQERAGLEGPLRDFIERYPDDDQTRLVRIYLAWILIQQKKLDEARAMVNRAQQGPAGSARDFAAVTEAAILIRVGKPEEALEQLVPLQGKIIDPTERLIFGEQLVQAALGGRRWRRAMDYMLDWLAQAPAEHREAVQVAVEHQLPRIPTGALERTLVSLDQEATDATAASTRAPARDWLRKAVRTYLTKLALERADVALARRLLDSGPPAIRRGKTGAALLRLAASGSVLPRVAGRAVGLVLSLGSATARKRSAEVAMGMSRALGLPAAAARPGSVRLLTRDDTEESGGLQRALAGLAGDGAAILVAGVDDEGALTASRFAELAAIPVILLSRPAGLPKPSYTFVLGVDPEATTQLLDEALRSSGATSPATVGPGGVACDAQASAAGRPRFPVYEWKRDGVDALLLTGDGVCARDVVVESTAAGLRLSLGFGLGCGELFVALRTKLPKVAVAVGHFPVSNNDAPPDSMTKWSKLAGSSPSWYHTLGHDAALLAAAALAEFPLQRVDDAREVAKLHRRAQAKLASATAAVWSSTQQGFMGKRVLEREPRVVTSAGGP